MTSHNRRLKVITFGLGASNFECQIQSWMLNNDSKSGDYMYTYCPDGEFIEETDGEWSVDLTFFADWTAGGISDFLMANDQTDVTFQLDHHPDITGEHVRWTGTLHIMAPSTGGDVRTTETQKVTFKIIGIPVYTRP